MKRFVLITAILFVACVGCERHNAGELAAAEPVPSPSVPQEDTRPKDAWDKSIAVGTIAMAIFALASIYVAIRTEHVFSRIVKALSQIQTRADDAGAVRTMATCIEQYQELENKLQVNKLRPGTITGDRYFELLWNLHFAEFHFFKRGFLPPEVYSLWLWVRHQDYHNDKIKSALGKTEVEGWTHAKMYLRDDDFAKFVESWLTKPDLSKSEIMKLLPPTNVALRA
jgi:hypothetical protein